MSYVKLEPLSAAFFAIQSATINIDISFDFRWSERTSTLPTSWSIIETSLKLQVTFTDRSFFIRKARLKIHRAKRMRRTRSQSRSHLRRPPRARPLRLLLSTARNAATWSSSTTPFSWTSSRRLHSASREAKWLPMLLLCLRFRNCELIHNLLAERSQICIR